MYFAVVPTEADACIVLKYIAEQSVKKNTDAGINNSKSNV
jgi:hypothetical protein